MNQARVVTEIDANANSQQRPAWNGLWLWAALVAAAVWSPKWRAFLLGIGLLAIVTMVHLAPSAIWGVARGVRILAVGLFFGNWLARFRLGGVPVRINILPTGGYVQFAGMDDADAGMSVNQQGVPFEQTYNAQPRWQKIVLSLAMPLASLALAVAMLGPSAATESFVRGLGQFTIGAFSPRAERVDAIARLFALLHENELALALGVIAAKNAALNALPVPGITNGGVALMESVGAVVPFRRKPLAFVQIAGLALFLLIVGMWASALGVYLFSGPSPG